MNSLSWRVATAVGSRRETPTASTLVLRIKDWPGHQAGQHLVIRLTAPDGYTASRSYSIASAWNRDWNDEPERAEQTVDVTIERFDDGEVSPYLADAVDAGDEIEVRGPVGRWFVWRPTQREPIQLVAGGSGIVPLMSMLRARELAQTDVPFNLLYSVASPDGVFYRDELAHLASAENVDIDYVWTREAPPETPRPIGRITEIDFVRTIAASEQPTCYVCGSNGFVETATPLLLSRGHDASRVRTERFGGAT